MSTPPIAQMLKTKIATVILAISLAGCANLDGPPRVAVKFGVPQPQDWTRTHLGWDFDAAQGTPVYAARSGRVTVATTINDFSGTVQQWPKVEILHDDARSTFYLHIDRVQVRAGDSVERGQLIAYTALTGPGAGGSYWARQSQTQWPHLHLELHNEHSRRIDPNSVSWGCPGSQSDYWWPIGCHDTRPVTPR